MIAKIVRMCEAKGDSVLIAVSHVNHVNKLKELLPEAKVMTGEDGSDRRKKVLEKFRSKEINVVISTLLGEGVDIPSLNAVINAAGGRDIRQLVGRALRKHPGKTVAKIYDFVDNQHIITLRNSQARIAQLKQEEEFRIVHLNSFEELVV